MSYRSSSKPVGAVPARRAKPMGSSHRRDGGVRTGRIRDRQSEVMDYTYGDSPIRTMKDCDPPEENNRWVERLARRKARHGLAHLRVPASQHIGLLRQNQNGNA